MEPNNPNQVPQAPTASVIPPSQNKIPQQNPEKPVIENGLNSQEEGLSMNENPNNKDESNRKTSIFSILSLIFIILWLMPFAFLALLSISKILYISIMKPSSIYISGDLLPLILDLFSMISMGLLILCPPLALACGIISHFQSNNSKKGKELSEIGIILGALLCIPAFLFWILFNW